MRVKQRVRLIISLATLQGSRVIQLWTIEQLTLVPLDSGNSPNGLPAHCQVAVSPLNQKFPDAGTLVIPLHVIDVSQPLPGSVENPDTFKKEKFTPQKF
jgi:hypothetical protein